MFFIIFLCKFHQAGITRRKFVYIMLVMLFSAYDTIVPIMCMRSNALIHIYAFNQFMVFEVINMLNKIVLF